MNLLVTGAWDGAKENMDVLAQMGHCVCFLQQEADELPCAYSWVEGVIANSLFRYHPIEQFQNLRYIQLTSAGFDRVPMDYIRAHGIEIHNARGVYSIPMAEFAISGVLQLYKQSRLFYERQKKHTWEKHRGLMELSGKTVCIVGCGSVGTECAKRFRAFGCVVRGLDIQPYACSDYDEMLPLENLYLTLRQTDVVIVTVPLTDATRHLINEEALQKMKNGAIFVNIARGAVADSKALTRALQQGSLLGAVLDVFEEEPLSQESPLWNMENVLLTPHNSFVGDGNKNRLTELVMKMIEGV